MRRRTVIKGSCLCGGIRFEIDAVRSLTHCHCENCRKLSGAAFASYVHVDPDKFRLLCGEDMIQQFESAPGSFRGFCRVCGSIAPGKAPYLTTVSIPAGLLDDDPGVRPKLHVFAGFKAPWWEITDGLPQHQKWVTGSTPPPRPHSFRQDTPDNPASSGARKASWGRQRPIEVL
jgi:hypothetical protein